MAGSSSSTGEILRPWRSAISSGTQLTVQPESGTIWTRLSLSVKRCAALFDIWQYRDGDSLSLSPPTFLTWCVLKLLLFPLLFFALGGRGGEGLSGSDSAPDPSSDSPTSSMVADCCWPVLLFLFLVCGCGLGPFGEPCLLGPCDLYLCLPRDHDLSLGGPLCSGGHSLQSLYLCPGFPHHLQGEVHWSLVCSLDAHMKHLALPLVSSLLELLTRLALFLEGFLFESE